MKFIINSQTSMVMMVARWSIWIWTELTCTMQEWQMNKQERLQTSDGTSLCWVPSNNHEWVLIVGSSVTPPGTDSLVYSPSLPPTWGLAYGGPWRPRSCRTWRRPLHRWPQWGSAGEEKDTWNQQMDIVNTENPNVWRKQKIFWRNYINIDSY